MAGLFYLPRLFVYHAGAEPGSESSETFKVMERKLLTIIMNPALVLTWVLGILMLLANPSLLMELWMQLKLVAAAGLTGVHFLLWRWVEIFAQDRNTRSHVFYRYINEVPTLMMIFIVVMAVIEPF